MFAMRMLEINKRLHTVIGDMHAMQLLYSMVLKNTDRIVSLSVRNLENDTEWDMHTNRPLNDGDYT